MRHRMPSGARGQTYGCNSGKYHAKYQKLDAEVVNTLVGAMQSLTERRLLCRLIPSDLASFPSTMHRSRCAHCHREGGAAAWPSSQIALGRGTQQAPSPSPGPLPFAPPLAAGQTPPFPSSSFQVGPQPEAARRLACRTRPQGELGCQCGGPGLAGSPRPRVAWVRDRPVVTWQAPPAGASKPRPAGPPSGARDS